MLRRTAIRYYPPYGMSHWLLQDYVHNQSFFRSIFMQYSLYYLLFCTFFSTNFGWPLSFSVEVHIPHSQVDILLAWKVPSFDTILMPKKIPFISAGFAVESTVAMPLLFVLKGNG